MASQATVRSAVAEQRRLNRRPSKLKIPLYPLGVERDYRRSLRAIPVMVWEMIEARLMPLIPDAVASVEATRTDAFPKDLNEVISGIRFAISTRYPESRRENMSRVAAERTENFNKRQVNTKVLARNKLPLIGPEPWLPEWTESFVYINTRLIESIPERYLDNVAAIVNEGVLGGDLTRDIKKQIRDQFGVSDRRAEFIARDQVSKLNGQVNRERLERAGFDKYVWRTAGDASVRESHAALEGTVHSWDSPPAVGHPGEDYNCLVAGTLVEFPNPVLGGFKRFYEGTVVEVTCESGVGVSVTPNHPILTLRGWVLAKDLQPSDQLLESFEPNVPVVSYEQVNDRTARCEDVFDLLEVRGAKQRIAGRDVQFHGDGSDHEVEVVTLPSRLTLDARELAGEEFKDSIFADAHLTEGSLVGERGLPKLGSVPLPPTASVVRFGGLTDALGRSHARPLELLRLGRAADLHAHLQQTSPNHAAARAKLLGDLVLAQPSLVELADLGHRQVFAIPGHILLSSKILCIGTRPYKGEVYNFETSSNYYLAGQLIVSNCRCSAEPYLDEEVKAMLEEAAEPTGELRE